MIFRLVRALAYATVFIGVLGVLLPARVLEAAGARAPATTGIPQIAGVILVAAGAILAAWCLLVFVYFESSVLVGYGVVLLAAAHMFVVLYEEPVLSDKFGNDYDAYCRRVRRWLPRR